MMDTVFRYCDGVVMLMRIMLMINERQVYIFSLNINSSQHQGREK